MKSFDELGLAGPILRALAGEGYETPTPIQAKAIPVMIEGRDVVGIAQTGTGKTAAFVLPILHAIRTKGGKPGPRTCRALILAPTRELAAQIHEQVRAYGKFMRVSSAIVVGGVKYPPQIKAMARGVDVLVATPGRLVDHLQSGYADLSAVEMAVLDEADQMLDLGFLPPIKRILAVCGSKRQTALLSATMPKPIRALAQEFLTDPLEISVAPQSKPIEQIAQQVRHVEAVEKPQALIELLGETPVERGIVFTRTKYGADKLARKLNQAGYEASAIHGNKTQSQRQRTLKEFKTGRIRLLVATDIAARGIDIDDVSHVFNYELPNVPESYVHRIGRTARAGRSGVAISLCDGEERPYLRDIERLIQMRIAVVGNEPPPLRKTGKRRPAANNNRPRTRKSRQAKRA